MQDIQHCLANVFADPAIPNHFLNNSLMGKLTKKSVASTKHLHASNTVKSKQKERKCRFLLNDKYFSNNKTPTLVSIL